ncbi:uncharacterized protein M2323_001820 [Rhodoblastus acidophilus]|uniref:anaerobic sulfatase maturase n=1 Tax=Rhodoblastus acidophilus TaxID=1074 RepID=UPI00222537E7|nr:anaerobic sulfatase maturase [Rhodoblastus acidophilus]MCW2283748.1 uncharacterized protein [Rhodoblastus acidophilus]MCW2332903.1 uncharacterized protein [Rhodoblastus acidophilus]
MSKRPAKRPFHLMAKPTGFRCNIACDYCFYLEKEAGALKPQSPQLHMDDATLDAYVRAYIEANPVDEVEFAWQGGEPTLAGLDFFEKALACQARHARGKTIRNSMQTNGLLIDERWARFLAANAFVVGISVDGPPEIHDCYRRARNGKGVYDEVARAIALFKKHGVEHNILAVVNSVTAEHPVEVYRHLTRELGAQHVQFIPAVERRPAGLAAGELLHPQVEAADAALTDWSVTGEAYGRFTIAVFDEWVQRDVGRVFVQLFENTLAAFAGETPSLCVMRPTCGQSLVIEMNGDVYSCDHYVYPQHRLGNVRRDDLAAMVSGAKQRDFGMAKADLSAKCMKCDWRFVCRGGCPKHRIHRAGTHWHNHLCAGYEAMFAHMAPYMRFMAERLGRRQSPAAVMGAVAAIRAAQTSGSAADA